MINWSLIDKIVYINLAKRPDRKAEIIGELKKVQAPEEKIIHFDAIEEEEGALGCAKSHLNVLIMAQINGWNNVLILEDDMVFENDEQSIERANVFLSELARTDWDVGFLSASYYIIKKVKPAFYKVEFAFLANSYLVNRPYYKTLMHNFSQAIYRMEQGEARNKAGLDTNWLKLMEEGRWYGVYPCIGHQRPGLSDIEHVEMDRRQYFKRPIAEIKRYGSF
ncbi:Glycosyltransferase family 25 (LPS biosynthesis protein) [Cedecea lapagei]|uniref:Glycosyltransferase family 25 (LPS biosynthesis protein) n=1 Tax=Cedecea lapagei TaxID=158823 RepID=A0A447V6A3_9ENTR|nr:glycosyltransferase family 25 protein [Cedecea lapagei]VEC00470.1 Glycosyltransferase family 25 (LPS biosynthesis protein) [Cedecea lapagei]